MFDADQFDADHFAEKAARAATLLKSMSNEHRLMILCRLAAGEQSVGALGADIALSQSALSQHLAVLREQGLVATRRDGQSILYSIHDPAAVKVINTLVSIYCPEMLK